MILKDFSFNLPEENILFDEVLFSLAEKGKIGESVRFWQSEETFIVLGRISSAENDIKSDMVSKDNIPVLRRASGGGTVVQGVGCLNYTFVLSKDKNVQLNDLKKSYQIISNMICDSLSLLDIDASYFPISDIALTKSKQKISGNAQKRGRGYVLHHGTLLYDFDLPLIERYLKMPIDRPDYRGEREHLSFVANIDKEKDVILNAFKDTLPIENVDNLMSEDEKHSLNQLMQNRENLFVQID